MNKVNKISEIIASKVLKKYKLQLEKNIVVARIEALLLQQPKLMQVISANLNTITVKEAKVILATLILELNKTDKTWKQRFRKEILFFRLEERKNYFKTIVLLSFFFMVLKPHKRLRKRRRAKYSPK